MQRNVVLEKWTFDLRTFPVVEKSDRDTPFEGEIAENDTPAISLKNRINIANLEAQFRAVLSRMSSASARLSALPKDKECSFSVSIEVRDNADRPVGRVEKEERKWIAAEPEPWSDADEQHGGPDGGEQSTKNVAVRNGNGRTVPVRRLEAGQLRMEVWIEESKEKFSPIATSLPITQ